MKKFTGGRNNRVVVLELVRGEDLIPTVESQLAELGIKNASVMSAVGSLQKIHYHRPTSLAPATVDEWLDVEAPLEICSLSGTVFDGVAHFHFSASGVDGFYGGHLDGAEVLYLFEITLVEIEGLDLERRWTKEKVKKLFPIGSPVEE